MTRWVDANGEGVRPHNYAWTGYPMTRMKGIFLPGLVLPDRAMESEIYREGREIAFEAP